METIPTSMKAAAVDQFGGIDKMKIKTVPVPQIADNEVLIKLEAAGVGVWDPFEREGGFKDMSKDSKPQFPYIMGSEGAGTIVSVGDKVTEFKIGDNVYSPAFLNPKGGFYAEYIAVKEDMVSPIRKGMSMEQAAAMSADAITALRGLEDILNLKKDESIMIFGASGGIGHIAVQLAKKIGARVFAVASGRDGVSYVQGLGADKVVEGHSENVLGVAKEFASGGIDAALVTAGGKVTDDALKAIKDGGRVAYPSGVMPEPTVRSSVKLSQYDGDPDAGIIRRLNEMIDSIDNFEVHVSKTFPLEDVAQAHKSLDEHYLGKLALRIH